LSVAAAVGVACVLYVSQVALAQERPNILFCIADDWSQEHAGAYGCRWVETPSFDRVAREGVLFANCFTSNPKCSPCRASILTGRNTWQLEEACCHFGVFPAKWPVYPDLLEDAGYHVGYTGKGWGPGDAQAGGFKRNPAGPAYNAKRARPPHRGMSNVDYAANFIAFLEEREEGQPFCFWYGASEPHRVYEAGIGRQAGKRVADVELPAYYPDSNAIREDFLDYAVEVEWFDTHLGRILTALEETGELDRTLVVVTSDHGAPFPRIKGQIYEHGFHLPLAIRWAGHVQAGRTVEDFINVRDFMPTFLEAAGVERPDSVTGTSFLGILESDESGWVDRSRNRMLIGKERHDIGRPFDWGYPVRAIRTPEYLYIHNYEPGRWPAGNPETGYRNCDASPTMDLILRSFNEYYSLSFGMRPREELYRITDDPDCVNNLAESAEHRQAKEDLREEMEQKLRDEEDPRMFGRGEIFESYDYVGGDGHSYQTWLEFRK
jgi:N-sulfoglucosamine sulfohydrolase